MLRTSSRLACCLLAPLLITGASKAATYTVTSTADTGASGTLRWAINQANGNSGADTIDFSLSTPATITLTSQLPAITESVTIDGPGVASDVTISGASAYRILFVNTGTVVIRDLTLANGHVVGGNGGASRYAGGGGGAAGVGAALFVNAGNVTVRNVVFSGNSVVGGDGGDSHTSNGADGGGGGGGFAGNGADGSSSSGGNGGASGDLGGTPGLGGSPGTAGGNGGGGGGGDFVENGGAGGAFAGGGGGGSSSSGGAGGFGGGGGGSGDITGSGGAGGTHGGAGGTSNTGYGGGGGGGAGLGGALFANAGTTTLINCTFNSNTANFGAGGTSLIGFQAGQDGQGKGGAIYAAAAATVKYANLTYGTGGSANAASDAASSGTDNANLYGTISLAYPIVDSITRVNPATINASTASFTVVFSESVTGVDTSDFSLAATGVVGASITNVTGSGTTYTVTVGTGGGDGTLRLDFVDDDSVVGGSTMLPVGDTGAGNGSFNSGQSYTLDKTSPQITSIQVIDTQTIDVTFDETPASGATTTASYALSGAGRGTLATQPDSAVNTSGHVYRLHWNSGEMRNGASLTLSAAVADSLGNTLGAPQTLTNGGVGVGPVVTLSSDAPAETNFEVVVIITSSEPVGSVDSSKITATNATVEGVTGAGTTYFLTLVPTANGDFSVQLASGALLDAAGNGSSASNTLSRVYVALIPPTVEPVVPTPDPTPEPTPEPTIPPTPTPVLTLDVTSQKESVTTSNVSFIITVSNDGDGDASDVVLEFPIPKGAEFVSIEQIPDITTQAADLKVEQVDNTIRVTVGAVIAGKSVRFNAIFKATSPADIQLEAALSADNAETVSALSDVVAADVAEADSCDNINLFRVADCCGPIGLAQFGAMLLTLAGFRQCARRRR